MTTRYNTTLFGTPLHKLSQHQTNRLTKYKLTHDLTDMNFTTWSQAGKEVVMSMSLEKNLKVPNFSEPNQTQEEP